MQISVTGRHCEVTSAQRKYLDARLERLHRFADRIQSAQVTLSAEKHRSKAEVVLHLDGRDFRSRDTSEDMYAAIDGVAAKLEKQLRRFKSRRTTARKTAARKTSAAKTNGQAALSGTLRVLRAGSVGSGTERHDVLAASDYPLETLTVDEAILRLEQRDEGFVVFSSTASELIHIVYKMQDGNYGVLNLHATH
jgi:putative sigma-54 modulation protein